MENFKMSDENNRTRQVMDLLPADWDKRPILLAYEIRDFLETVKDTDTNIDSGTDGVSGDLWVKVQGIEYYINIRKSNSQLVKEGKPVPQY
jgi:hypothetical protein